MGATVAKIMMNIFMGLVTEQVIKAVIATGLKYLVSSTKNDLDDQIAKPIIEALEK